MCIHCCELIHFCLKEVWLLHIRRLYTSISEWIKFLRLWTFQRGKYSNSRLYKKSPNMRAGVAQWIVCLACNQSVMSLIPTKGTCCLLEQEILHSLHSTGWFQERIQAWFTQSNSSRKRVKTYSVKTEKPRETLSLMYLKLRITCNLIVQNIMFTWDLCFLC